MLFTFAELQVEVPLFTIFFCRTHQLIEICLKKQIVFLSDPHENENSSAFISGYLTDYEGLYNAKKVCNFSMFDAIFHMITL